MSQAEPSFNFRSSLKMLVPIFITILGAAVLTLAVTYTWAPPGQPDPAPINPITEPENPSEDPAGTAGAALGNALLYVSIALVGGVFFVLLLKWGKGRLLEVLFSGVMGLSAFFFGLIIIPALIIQFVNLLPFLIPLLGANNDQVVERIFYLAFILALALGVVNVAALGLQRLKNPHLHNGLMIMFGMSMGVIFGTFFEAISLVVVLVGLSLYDIYAVFYGPLKHMFALEERSSDFVDSEEDEVTEEDDVGSWNDESSSTGPVDQTQQSRERSDTERYPKQTETKQTALGSVSLPIYTTPFISIGLGDFVFFSVLVSKSVYLAIKGGFLWLPVRTSGVYFGLLLLPFLGVLVGTYLTYRLLEKREVLPALPIPIFCGLLGFFLALVLQI